MKKAFGINCTLRVVAVLFGVSSFSAAAIDHGLEMVGPIVISGRRVTVAVQHHGKTAIVQVGLLKRDGEAGIYYSDIGVRCFDANGIEIPAMNLSKSNIYIEICEQHFGMYKVGLVAGQRLQSVRVEIGSNSQTFKLPEAIAKDLR